MYYTAYFGVVFMSTMPVVVAFGDFQALNNGLVNLSFLFTASTVIFRFVQHARQEATLLGELMGVQSHFETTINEEKLTTREKELLNYFLDESLTYQSIGEKLCIDPKTVSIHASNIFKKINIKDRKELLQKHKSSMF